MRVRAKKGAITASRDLTIVNELGLHARPAAQFVSHANSFHCDLWLIKDGKRFSATSMVEVLRANLECGATVTLEAHGVDAESAVERLAKVVAKLNDNDM